MAFELGLRDFENARRTLSGSFKIVTVTDAEILRAVRFLLERAKLLTEPAGAAAAAALLEGKISFQARGPVAVVLSGGNFDVRRLQLGYESE